MPESNSFGKIAERRNAVFKKLPKPDTAEDIRKADEKEKKEKDEARKKMKDFKANHRKINQETPDNLYKFLSATSFKELLGKKKGEGIKSTPLCVDDFYPEEDFSSNGFMNYEEVKKEFDALTKNEQQKLKAYVLTVTPTYMFDPCLDKKNPLDKNHVGTATFLILEIPSAKRLMFVEVPGISTDKTADNPNMRYFKFAPDAEALKGLYQRAVDAPANALKLLQKAQPNEAKKAAQLPAQPKTQIKVPEKPIRPEHKKAVPPLLKTPHPMANI